MRIKQAYKTDENFRKVAAMFPNAVAAALKNEEVVRTIDKDVLMQGISCSVVDGDGKHPQFTLTGLTRKSAFLLPMNH